jgi:hypothetical protein
VRGRENSLGTRSDRAKNRVSFWIEREKSEDLREKYARARRGPVNACPMPPPPGGCTARGGMSPRATLGTP